MKSKNIFIDALVRFFAWSVATVGVLFSFGILLDILEVIVNSKLRGIFGYGATLFTAVIGTPLHELSHFLMCKLFGFKVTSVELLRPFSYQFDGVLGKVSFIADTSTIKGQIGCFFTGIAPMIIGGLAILLFVRLFVPEAYKEAGRRADEAWKYASKYKAVKVAIAFLGGFFKGLFSIKGKGIIRVILCFYVVSSIAMHMTYSIVDIANGITGLYIVLGIIFLFSLITAVLKTKYVEKAIETGLFFAMFFSLGLVCDLLLLGVASLVNLF